MMKYKGKRLAVVAATVAVMAIGIAAPAAAHPGHQSCKGFGDFFAQYARGGYEDFGLDNPGLAPFATEPGIIAATIELEHELFCES